eukprot:9228194-Prorocentrum_lima.AAC.1
MAFFSTLSLRPPPSFRSAPLPSPISLPPLFLEQCTVVLTTCSPPQSLWHLSGLARWPPPSRACRTHILIIGLF